MPGYGEIRLSRTLMGPVYRQIEAAGADAIHIATEGPLGIMARRWCRKNRFPFSTAYHTQFPEYLRARLPVPLRWSYRFLRWFHGAAAHCLVGTPHLKGLLEQRGFTNVAIWPKGVDTELFHPDKRMKADYPAPVFLYVGRVAVEKNIQAFLDLDLPGTKMVVGGGPSLDRLRAEYPDAVFTGPRQGEELARTFASGGRVRVSEQDRHVRAGAARGAGERNTCRRVPRHRADRRDRRRACGGARRRSQDGGAQGAGCRPGDVPRLRGEI